MNDLKFTTAGEVYDRRHGGPYDRGAADSYYRRGYQPHFFTGGSYNSDMIEEKNMSAEEVAEYSAGYYDNEEAGFYKEWN